MSKIIHPTEADVGKCVRYRHFGGMMVELKKINGQKAVFRMVGSNLVLACDVTDLRMLYKNEERPASNSAGGKRLGRRKTTRPRTKNSTGPRKTTRRSNSTCQKK